MWQLSEDFHDFTAKYEGSIATLKYNSPTIENKSYTFPFELLGLTRTENTGPLTVVGNILTKNKWKSKKIIQKYITELEFTFPYLGYVNTETYGPVYVSRRQVKQYRRGWGNHSIRYHMCDIVRNKLYNNESLRNAGLLNPRYNEKEIISAVFKNNIVHTKLKDVHNCPWGTLSTNFAFVNNEDTYILYYQTIPINIGLPLTIPEELNFLKEVYFEEVLECQKN